MENNYEKQAAQAKLCFLTYDQKKLIEKHHLKADENYLYVRFLSVLYRISRTAGDLEFLTSKGWEDGNSHGEVMTILDLLCDSKDTRHLSGRLLSMQDFGHRFHQNLGEENRDAFLFQDCPQKLKTACQNLGGVPFAGGDVAYTIPVFEDLSVTLQFWLGDEEFSPRLRYLWDENALQYLKYETMYFAVDVLIAKIRQFL